MPYVALHVGIIIFRVPNANAMIRPALLMFCVLLSATRIAAQIAQLEKNWYQVNGVVNDVVEDTLTNTLYLGGAFTSASPAKPADRLASLDGAVGTASSVFPSANGQVIASVPDGNGGVFVGGSYTQIGGVARTGLAHVLADGSVSPWAPVLAGMTVYCMALKGDTLVIGGTSGTVNGATRTGFAGVHATTGAVLALNPLLSNNGFGTVVYSMAFKGDTLYFGGLFDAVNGQTRNHVAAMRLATGALLPWNPDANAVVRALAVGGGKVYLGGFFTAVNGTIRNYFAAVNQTTGTLVWNIFAVNGTVHALAVHGGQVYVGGEFTQFGLYAHARLARVNVQDQVPGPWSPNMDGTVYALKVMSNTLYAGGAFTAVNGGAARGRAAAFSLAQGEDATATAWDPNADNTIWTLAVPGTGRLVAGGDFTNAGVFARTGLLALNTITGEPTSWASDVNGPVFALALGNDVLYVGGRFSALGTTLLARSKAGAVDRISGVATSWSPIVSGAAADAVNDIALSGANVILAGDFTHVNFMIRSDVAMVSASNATLQSWTANTTVGIGPLVYQMATSGDTLFIAGVFTSLNFTSRTHLGSVLLSTGQVTAFTPEPNGGVLDLNRQGSTLYCSGAFTTIGGASAGGKVAAVNTQTGANTGWITGVNAVSSIAANQRTVYFQDTRPDLNGVTVSGLHGVERSTGAPTGFSVQVNNSIVRIRRLGNGTFALGGDFTQVAGEARQNFAVVRDVPAIRMNVLLEGPYVNTSPFWMTDALRSQSLVPLMEPYAALGYAHTGGGGGETTTSALLQSTGSNAPMEWVVVELRNATNPATILASRSALLQRDGDLMSASGSLLPSFAPDANVNYHVSIRHRNHLGCMTATPLGMKFGVHLPFSDPAFATYGTDAQRRWREEGAVDGGREFQQHCEVCGQQQRPGPHPRFHRRNHPHQHDHRSIPCGGREHGRHGEVYGSEQRSRSHPGHCWRHAANEHPHCAIALRCAHHTLGSQQDRMAIRTKSVPMFAVDGVYQAVRFVERCYAMALTLEPAPSSERNCTPPRDHSLGLHALATNHPAPPYQPPVQLSTTSTRATHHPRPRRFRDLCRTASRARA